MLTHIARNADSMVRVLDAAERGEVVDRYPGDSRNDGIEAGSARPAAAQVADVAAIERAAGGGVGAADEMGRAQP